MAKIPKFKTEEEEAIFWKNHDFADYIDDTEEEEFELSSELIEEIDGRYVIRLNSEQRSLLEKISSKKHIDPQALILEWINAGIKKNINFIIINNCKNFLK